jgi:hypothetical protein
MMAVDSCGSPHLVSESFDDDLVLRVHYTRWTKLGWRSTAFVTTTHGSHGIAIAQGSAWVLYSDVDVATL